MALVMCLCAGVALAQDLDLAAAPATACLCTCSSPHHSKTEGYYEPPTTGSCSGLNTQACINQGERGTLSGCVSAPRPVTTKAELSQETTDLLVKLAEAAAANTASK
jgi:hypothetical protein